MEEEIMEAILEAVFQEQVPILQEMVIILDKDLLLKDAMREIIFVRYLYIYCILRVN